MFVSDKGAEALRVGRGLLDLPPSAAPAQTPMQKGYAFSRGHSVNQQRGMHGNCDPFQSIGDLEVPTVPMATNRKILKMTANDFFFFTLARIIRKDWFFVIKIVCLTLGCSPSPQPTISWRH